ncbi:Uncharacterized protein C3orf20 homolog [Vulpes lagopus]
MNYSWHDLIEGAYECATKNSIKNSALQGDPKAMTQISSYSREEYHKENHLVKVKKDHHVPSAHVNQNQHCHVPQDSNLPVVIHFSLLSKICLENGWIFQHPHSNMEILKWKTILSTAVKRLQEAIIQIVNKFIKVEISGRFAITLVYQWHPQSLKLSLAPVKCKFFPPSLPEEPFPDVNPISAEARELFKAYRVKGKHMISTTQDEDPRIESLHIGKMPNVPKKVIRKQKVSSARFPLQQSAEGKDENKEYLRYRNTFLKLKGVFNPVPLFHIQKTPVRDQSFRLPPPSIESKDAWFSSQLLCPVVLRRTLCGKEGGTCQCSTYSIPEVTDLEYDHLISNQLSSMDQVIIVHVFSANETDKTIIEMAKVYRKLNRFKSMPCIQSCSDPFRMLKYNITSACKFTGGSCPLLVQRHNVIPGIFLKE